LHLRRSHRFTQGDDDGFVERFQERAREALGRR
jgi:hypothetical protein